MSIPIPFEFPGGYKPTVAGPAIAMEGPYNTLDAAQAAVPNSFKPHVTVKVGLIEYWWQGGVAIENLIPKVEKVFTALEKAQLANNTIQLQSVTADLDTLTGGIPNVKPDTIPGVTPGVPNNATIVAPVIAGTYTGFGGVIISTDDMDAGAVQMKKDLDGTWVKHIIVITLNNYDTKVVADAKFVQINPNGEILGASNPAYTQWIHERGLSELAGNSINAQVGIMMYEQITNNAVFNEIVIPAWVDDTTALTLRVYKGNALSSTPNPATLLEELAYTVGSFNRIVNGNAIVTLTNTYPAKTGDYISIFMLTTAGTVIYINMWNIAYGAAPERHRFYYIQTRTGAWTTAWDGSSAPGYGQTSFVLNYNPKFDGATINDDSVVLSKLATPVRQSIETTKTKAIKTEHDLYNLGGLSKNKFDFSDIDIERGKYIAGDGSNAGTSFTNPAYSITGYINITAGQTLHSNKSAISTAIGINLYDNNKVRLATVNSAFNVTADVDGYARFTINVNSTEDISLAEVQIEEGTISTSVVPYGVLVSGKKLSDQTVSKQKLSRDLAAIIDNANSAIILKLPYDTAITKVPSTGTSVVPFEDISGVLAVFNKLNTDFNAIRIPAGLTYNTTNVPTNRKWKYIQVCIKNSYGDTTFIAKTQLFDIGGKTVLPELLLPLMLPDLSSFITLNDASFSGSTFCINTYFYTADMSFAYGGSVMGDVPNYVAGSSRYVVSNSIDVWSNYSGSPSIAFEQVLLTNLSKKASVVGSNTIVPFQDISGVLAEYNKINVDFNAIRIPAGLTYNTVSVPSNKRWKYIQVCVKNAYGDSTFIAKSKLLDIGGLTVLGELVLPLMLPDLSAPVTLNDASFSGPTFCINSYFFTSDMTFAYGGTIIGSIPNYVIGSSKYVTANSITSWSNYSANPPMAFEQVLLVSPVGVAHIKQIDDLVIPISETPEISLPDNYNIIVGDTFQMFWKGVIKAVNPYNYDIVVNCSKGAKFPRYFEFTPVSGDIGNVPFTLKVKNSNGILLATKTINLTVKAAVQSPATLIKDLCIGDSFTDARIWPAEALRRLVGTGGTPAGLGFSNYAMVGRKPFSSGGVTGGVEGNSGWSWIDYLTYGRPAFTFTVTAPTIMPAIEAVYSDTNGKQYKMWWDYSTTSLKFYVLDGGTPPSTGTLTKVSGVGDATLTYSARAQSSANIFRNESTGLLDIAGYVNKWCGGSIDIITILMTWNGQYGNRTDFSVFTNYAKTFFDHVHAVYPLVKIKLMGVSISDLRGGVRVDGSPSENTYTDTYGLVVTVLNMNKAYQDLANDPAYSSFVEFIHVSSQVDSENNLPAVPKPVNTRATIPSSSITLTGTSAAEIQAYINAVLDAKKIEQKLTELIGTQDVHPNDDGYRSIGDAKWRNMVANNCQ